MKAEGSHLKFLIKDTILYGGASAIGRMIHVITFPLVIRALDTTDFGTLDILRIFGHIMLMFCLFGLDQSAVILSKDEKDRVVRNNYMGKGLRAAFINSVCCTLILFALSQQFLGLYLDAKYKSSFHLLIYSIPSMTVFQFVQSILKWHFKRAQFLIITLGNTVFVLTCISLLTLLDLLSIQSILATHLLSYSSFAVVGFFFCRQWVGFHLKKKLLPSMIIFGWPLLFNTVIAAMVPSIDRYFIASNLSIEKVGIYAVMFRISSIMRLPLSGLQMAFGPFALMHKDDKSAKVFFTNALILVTFASTLLASIIAINAPLLVSFIASNKYLHASGLLIPLTFAIVLESMCQISGYGIILSKKTFLSSISFSIQLISAAALVFAFIGKFELMGVAYGILLSKLIYFVIKSTFAKAFYKKNPNISISLLVVVIGFSLTFMIGKLNLNFGVANSLILVVFACLTVLLQKLKLFNFKILLKK